MELKKAFIILVDISGYTRFIKHHKVSLIHAESIISDLLEVVIESAQYPMVLNKLQGDAALFYAISDNTALMGQDILKQIQKFFEVFRKKASYMLSECDRCRCDACHGLDQLKLKAILHHGDIVLKKIQQFEEIAGEDVIIAHRLLKNSVPKKEYVLVSQSAYELSGNLDNRVPEKRVEKYDVGAVPVNIWYFEKELEQIRLSYWIRFKKHWELTIYFFKRWFKIYTPQAAYNSLKGL